MTLHKFVFSPTGGTKKSAGFLCQNWQGQENNIDLTTETSPVVDFQPGDLTVFALPVYAGRLPPAAVNRLQALKGNKIPAVALVVYGNRAYEDALLELKNTVNSLGFRCVAAVAAVARHSIVDSIAPFRPDLEDSVQLSAFFDKIQDKIRTASNPGIQTPEVVNTDTGTGTDKTLDFYVPGNFPYKEINPVPLVPELTGDCSFCGVCARRCPVKAISPDDYAQVDNSKCISCMRCLRICTGKARSLPSGKLQPLAARLEKLCSDRKENELFL